MSANNYTTSELVDLIKLLGHVPQSNSTFTVANILTLADLEMRTSISKQLKEADEGYFQTIVEHEQNETGEYPVPAGAIASAPYVVQIRNGQTIWPVSRQEVSELTTTNNPSVSNFSYFIRGNTLHVLPIEFGGVLRITYERRPSKLVAVSSCAQVSAINGQVITVTSVPSTMAVGTTVELQMANPQFDILSSCEITNVNGTDITLDGDVSSLSVGDYLCLEDQTCVPQIPVEFQQLLAQRVVCKIYELQGYMDKLQAAQAKLKEMEDALTALITPRVQASPKVINPSWGGRKPGGSFGRFNPPAGRQS